MKAPRLAIALVAVGACLLPLTNAGALSVPRATALALPKPNVGLNQGYLPFQSCSSLGNCAITGIYVAGRGEIAGVIESELKGVWRAPLRVGEPVGASAAKGVTMDGVACPADGSCVAIGQYVAATSQLPFVVSETAGKWSRGVALSLPANAIAKSESATPHSIACSSAGNCTVVGTYSTNATTSATAGVNGFIVSEHAGVWRHAQELSLPAGANANPLVTLSQISCATTTTCVAVGSYVDVNNVSRAIVVPEVNGAWQRALTVDLPGNASAFAGAQFNEVDCTPSGSCLAAGTYNTFTGAVQPLVALSVNGVWDRAQQVLLPHRAKNPSALLYGFKGVACASAGNCAFGGQYLDRDGKYQGFLDNIVNGVVQIAHVLALPAGALQAGHNGGVVSLSCPGVGTCVAGAAYLNAHNTYVAYLVSENRNVWSPGISVTMPSGSQAVGVAGGIYSVDCFSVSSCQVSGSYASSSSRYDGFTLVTGA